MSTAETRGHVTLIYDPETGTFVAVATAVGVGATQREALVDLRRTMAGAGGSMEETHGSAVGGGHEH